MQKIFEALISASLEMQISIASALAALVSALFSWRSYLTATKALRLAKLEFDERHGEIKPYLIDAITWDAEPYDKMVSIACSYTNSANAPNTLLRVELIVNLHAPGGELTKVIVDPLLTSRELPRGLQHISLPINLNPRSTQSGWISFKIPSHIAKSKTIDHYELIGMDAFGGKISLEAYILKKIEK